MLPKLHEHQRSYRSQTLCRDILFAPPLDELQLARAGVVEVLTLDGRVRHLPPYDVRALVDIVGLAALRREAAAEMRWRSSARRDNGVPA